MNDPEPRGHEHTHFERLREAYVEGLGLGIWDFVFCVSGVGFRFVSFVFRVSSAGFRLELRRTHW